MNSNPRISWRKSTRSSNGSGQCVEVGAWRTGSRSAGNGNCVEAGVCDCHGIAVRDSKFIDGGILTAPRTEWIALLAGVKTRHFDC